MLGGKPFSDDTLQPLASSEGAPFFFTQLVRTITAFQDASAFPLRLKARRTGGKTSDNHALPGMESESEKITANLSPAARAYLASLGLPDPDTDQATAELIWYHALAIGYSPAYLAENADGIRQDWPRIPLPTGEGFAPRLRGLRAAGGGLLDTEAPVPGVTAGKIRDELKHIAVFQAWTGNRRSPKPAIWI